MFRILTATLLVCLATLVVGMLPSGHAPRSGWSRTRTATAWGLLEVTNRSRGRGDLRALGPGEALCRGQESRGRRWKGFYLLQVEGAGPTVIRRFSTGARWRIRFTSLPQWWRLVPRGDRWVLRSPTSNSAWASVRAAAPLPWRRWPRCP